MTPSDRRLQPWTVRTPGGRVAWRHLPSASALRAALLVVSPAPRRPCNLTRTLAVLLKRLGLDPQRPLESP
jgi:hypothetical protein